MRFKLLFSIAVISLVLSCDNRDEPLYKAMEDLEISWSDEQLSEFVRKKENIALGDARFGDALIYRNKILRNSKDSVLLKYFNSMGIYHLEDMSEVVFRSLHRKLNNRPIELKEQLIPILKNWDEIKDCHNINFQRALKYYKKYEINDTVLVRMPIRNNVTGVKYICPETSGWVYNDSLDLLIKGIIKEKSDIQDTVDILFKLRVLSTNHDNIKVLMEDVNIGDEIEIDLKLDIVEETDIN